MDSTPLGLLARFESQPCDADAWQELLNIYRPWLLAWLHKESIQPTDADDIVQDVLVVLYQQLPNFRHNGKTGAFRTWLRGIVINRLRERRRSHKLVIEWPDQFGQRLNELADDESELSQLWESEHDRYVLQRLLQYIEGDFAARTWAAFRAFAIEKRPSLEVAEEFNMTVAALLTTKSRILRRLREVAKEIFPDA